MLDFDTLTLQIASYAHALRFDHVPPAIVVSARQRIVDALGCAMGGSDCEAAEAGRRLAQGRAPDLYPGRIIGSLQPASAETAAFTNTAMIRYLDFNEGHHGGHPSDMIGPLLALAEAAGASGRQLISAIVVSHEVALRMIRATKLREEGWDQGVAIGIGAAAGLGHLLGLPVERIAQGLAITVVANVPLRASRAGQLSHWKGAATAFACRNAVFAVQLAAEGVTGPPKPFEGRHGLWEQVTGPIALEPFSDAGGAFLLPTGHMKAWPVDGNAQAAVWAALELRRELSAEDIEDIDIATYWSAWHENASEPEKWDPQTRETADHSIPFVFARAFYDGTISLASFTPDAVRDPAIRPLMSRIRVRVDEEIDKRYAAAFPRTLIMRFDLTLRNGTRRSLEIVSPRGQPQNPMSDEEIGAKFLGLAEPVLGPHKAGKALEAWSTIEEAEDLGHAFDLLHFSAGSSLPKVRENGMLEKPAGNLK